MDADGEGAQTVGLGELRPEADAPNVVSTSEILDLEWQEIVKDGVTTCADEVMCR